MELIIRGCDYKLKIYLLSLKLKYLRIYFVLIKMFTENGHLYPDLHGISIYERTV